MPGSIGSKLRVTVSLVSLWKDVTYYLKSKQLDKATEGKSFLEQRQREEAKERAEKSLKWHTKVNTLRRRPVLEGTFVLFQYFTESGEQKWSYEKKLTKRVHDPS